jgi:aromatic ring-cleaving dioxygenase
MSKPKICDFHAHVDFDPPEVIAAQITATILSGSVQASS